MITWLLANKKLIGQITGAFGLLVALYQIHDHIYQAGIESERTRAQAALIEQAEKLKAKYEQQVQDALMLQQVEHAQAIDRIKSQTKIETQTKVVKEYVYKIKEIPAVCDDFMLDVGSVLIDSTNTVINASTTGTTSSN